MLATNNQMSSRDIQTNVNFIQKPQATISKAKPLNDNNLVMKPIPPVPTLKEEKPTFIFTCGRGEFLVESKETKQRFALIVK